MRKILCIIAALGGLSLMFLSSGQTGLTEVALFITGFILGILGTLDYICS